MTTVLVWDVERGKVVAGPIAGHTDFIMSVGSPPDGKRVSITWDSSVRVWAVESGESVSDLFDRPINTIALGSVTFSLDGKCSSASLRIE